MWHEGCVNQRYCSNQLTIYTCINTSSSVLHEPRFDIFNLYKLLKNGNYIFFLTYSTDSKAKNITFGKRNLVLTPLYTGSMLSAGNFQNLGFLTHKMIKCVTSKHNYYKKWMTQTTRNFSSIIKSCINMMFFQSLIAS